ncbi:MAG: acetyl/propionyl/methylcrotonyl-CoA carboxylase subunit alpha [Deltaproteobacteria bacterium]|nr:acetyl/propionyl/methylcrotonyl-CoA carboxylase subunit alpha [Deltaproteobacteria bacterium]
MNKKIKKILIANRGEIACRIQKTAQRLGIKTVAIYSDPDQNALFVKNADEAISIGGASAQESYLDQDKIFAAAKQSGADAIHPGYGFLSENASFAKRAQNEGLIFIGPSPEVIEKMGSKQASKNIMAKAGVPIIPGYQGKDQSLKTLIAEAKKVGFPLMVKASAGGGGKGLKMVEVESELQAAIESAAREAESSFGDNTLMIEKFITTPKHIEVQVFGDQHGNIVHLFERECSLQRRHQKVIEEAPSPTLNPTQRQAITSAAVKAAQAVSYFNAGTVEFIWTPNGEFYFLEMNTRLQVEHPVTEEITGEDLVEWQIKVAQGEKLPKTQEQINFCGHAMEARLYAEDPENDFLPATGTIMHLQTSSSAESRWDSGIKSGDEITINYDPMIAKLIAKGENREQARQNLIQALQDTAVFGVTNNIVFLKQLLELPEFIESTFHTGTIAKKQEQLQLKSPLFHKVPEAFAALALLIHNTPNPFVGFRMSQSAWVNDTLYQNKKPIALSYQFFSWDRVLVKQGDKEFKITEIKIEKHHIQFRFNSELISFLFHIHHNKIHLKGNFGSSIWQRDNLEQSSGANASQGGLTAPLPGKVLKLLVKEGDTVSEGQTLMIVEAMKMEHPIKASQGSKVKKVFFGESDSVNLGDVLIELQAS